MINNWASHEARHCEPIKAMPQQQATVDSANDGAFSDFNAPLAEQTSNPCATYPSRSTLMKSDKKRKWPKS